MSERPYVVPPPVLALLVELRAIDRQIVELRRRLTVSKCAALGAPGVLLVSLVAPIPNAPSLAFGLGVLALGLAYGVRVRLLRAYRAANAIAEQLLRLVPARELGSMLVQLVPPR